MIPDPQEQPTLTMEETVPLLGISRWAGYELVKRDEFPVQVLGLGRTIRVPTAPLLALLGLTHDGIEDGTHLRLLEHQGEHQ